MEGNAEAGNEKPTAVAANGANQSPAVASDVASSQEVVNATTTPTTQPEVSQQPSTSSENVSAANGKEVHVTEVTGSDVNSEPSSGGSKSAAEPAPTVRTEVRTQELTAVDKLNEHDTTSVPSGNPEVLSAAVAAAELTNGKHKMTAHDMDLAELKVKILCLEKNNMALKMELKCAELQVAAKEKLDAKKSRLIELLDAKLTALDKKNVRLVEMMEQLVKEKNDQSHKLVEASKTIEDMSRKLVDSERFRNDLLAANRDLKTMLGNVEDKSTQLARLAKEKVLKYKTENDRMQLELDGLMGAEVQQQTSPDPLIDDAIRRAEEFHQQVEAALTIAKSWKLEEPIDALKAALDSIGNVSATTRTATVEFLQGIKTSAPTTAAAAATQTSNVVDAQKLPESSGGALSSPPAAAADLAEQLVSKDREIANLRDELTRLKGAIGQLVGLNQGV